MRFEKLSRLALCCAGSGVFFVACGSDVEEDPMFGSSSTGAGGASSASSSASTGVTTTGSATASGTSSSTSSSQQSSSSGAGGGGPCEQACDKIANDCGFGDVCSQIQQLDCNSNPNADCYGQCILDADCAAIASLAGSNPDPDLVACASGCNGGQGGAGGGGQDCQGCAQSSCGQEAIACVSDSECQAWINCVQTCADPACVAACDATHIAAEPLYSDLKACLCTSCGTECAALDPCG